VESASDVEAMRLIRNSAREWMTNDPRPIGKAQQEIWWEAHKDTVQAFVYGLGDRTIGYGLLVPAPENSPGGLWCTLALIPSERGKGFGTLIYQHLVAKAGQPVWAEIFSKNYASIRAAEKAGFRRITSSNNRLIMCTQEVRA
jgi:RimJ/RimL family protein N-acetyltransferase